MQKTNNERSIASNGGRFLFPTYTLHPNFLFLLLTNTAMLHSFEKKKKLSLIFKYFCSEACVLPLALLLS